MEGVAQLSISSHQIHRRFCLTGDLEPRVLSTVCTQPLISISQASRFQNTITSNSKLPGWRRLAINPREIQIPGATRPTGTRPVNHETTAPARSALAAPPIRRWLGNNPTSTGPPLASLLSRGSVAAPPPLFSSPMPNGFETFASAPLGWLWSFFFRYQSRVRESNRSASRWCNLMGGRLATTTARTTWANGKHPSSPELRIAAGAREGFRWDGRHQMTGCQAAMEVAPMQSCFGERGLHETDVVLLWSRVTAVCRGQQGRRTAVLSCTVYRPSSDRDWPGWTDVEVERCRLWV